ncbi:hypothetical protein M2399_002552 [Pseudomonas sp. BIGb0450]|jgi:hypothetical protein|uniref:hypothetical protein n=1 Tax=Pseudomonas TaxID=286 RepID=UPI0015A45B85|nr:MULTISPECIES: hypothetical protein [Pseudomonas]MCS3417178.1 hypothetical protein [Pseudomonas sp. BIGb0558]MCS3437115.1 hypothetical protein [Pseudomonas sp. BIGb0450]NWD25629.1 hypothetical protein [Pseudomonas yamanorum]
MKLITVPLTQEALKLLDLDVCPESKLEQLHLSEAEHQQLTKSGIIVDINSKLGKIIDDYEDESIQGANDLTNTLAILMSAAIPENPELLKKLIKLTNTALKNNTGIFFFF